MITFNGRTHLSFTGLIYTNTHYWWHYLPSWYFIAGSLIGSVLPDIDIKRSMASKIVILPFHRLMRHRGAIHSIFSAIVFTSFGILIDYNFGLGIGFGYLLHLLGDLTTPMRLPSLFFPLKSLSRR